MSEIPLSLMPTQVRIQVPKSCTTGNTSMHVPITVTTSMFQLKACASLKVSWGPTDPKKPPLFIRLDPPLTVSIQQTVTVEFDATLVFKVFKVGAEVQFRFLDDDKLPCGMHRLFKCKHAKGRKSPIDYAFATGFGIYMNPKGSATKCKSPEVFSTRVLHRKLPFGFMFGLTLNLVAKIAVKARQALLPPPTLPKVLTRACLWCLGAPT